jgi:hypothetical protein
LDYLPFLYPIATASVIFDALPHERLGVYLVGKYLFEVNALFVIEFYLEAEVIVSPQYPYASHDSSVDFLCR